MQSQQSGSAQSFDYRLIDQSALEIVDTAKRTGAVRGPALRDAQRFDCCCARRTSTRLRATSSRSART